MKRSIQINALIAGTAMALASISAMAQTSTMPPLGTSQTPAAVGVSPQTAAEANRQAVQRNDTATVVRTGPNAAEASRSAASSAQRSASAPGSAGAMRPARADRN